MLTGKAVICADLVCDHSQCTELPSLRAFLRSVLVRDGCTPLMGTYYLARERTMCQSIVLVMLKFDMFKLSSRAFLQTRLAGTLIITM